MGSGASVAVVQEETLRPLDASDVNTPRGESAKYEVMRLRTLLAQHAPNVLMEMDQQRAVEVVAAADEAYQAMAPGIQDYLVQVFQAADTDGSGILSYDEFTRMLLEQCSGLGLTIDDLTSLQGQAAWYTDGQVTWNDFVLIAPQLLKNLSSEASEPSASDWCVLSTPDGTPYYYNKRTQESAWAPPEDAYPAFQEEQNLIQ